MLNYHVIYNCVSLVNLKLPRSLKEIGTRAAENCYYLETIEFAGSETEWKNLKVIKYWDLAAGTRTSEGTYKVIFKAFDNDEGTIGNNIKWKFYGASKLLVISGSGRMPDYSPENPAPWAKYKDKTTKVLVKNSISYVGSYAFYNHVELVYAAFAESVKEIGEHAFDGCIKLQYLYYPTPKPPKGPIPVPVIPRPRFPGFDTGGGDDDG